MTIAGVTVSAASLPYPDRRTQNTTVGMSADGSMKFYKYRDSDRLIQLTLKHITATVKASLIAALEADADYTIAIDPDTGMDLGGGDGTAVNAKWIDKEFNAVKVNHDAFDVTLNFVRVV